VHLDMFSFYTGFVVAAMIDAIVATVGVLILVRLHVIHRPASFNSRRLSRLTSGAYTGHVGE